MVELGVDGGDLETIVADDVGSAGLGPVEEVGQFGSDQLVLAGLVGGLHSG